MARLNIAGSLRAGEVAFSASDRQGSNFESCAWRTVSSHTSHHPQEILLAQFSLYVHNGGQKTLISFISHTVLHRIGSLSNTIIRSETPGVGQVSTMDEPRSRNAIKVSTLSNESTPMYSSESLAPC